jgi:hypothetical protein
MSGEKYIGGTTAKKLKQDLGLLNALYAFIIISLFLFLIGTSSRRSLTHDYNSCIVHLENLRLSILQL